MLFRDGLGSCCGGLPSFTISALPLYQSERYQPNPWVGSSKLHSVSESPNRIICGSVFLEVLQPIFERRRVRLMRKARRDEVTSGNDEEGVRQVPDRCKRSDRARDTALHNNSPQLLRRGGGILVVRPRLLFTRDALTSQLIGSLPDMT